MDCPKLYDSQLRQVGFSDGSGFSLSGVNPSNLCEADDWAYWTAAFVITMADAIWQSWDST
jgi:hypothetical protein